MNVIVRLYHDAKPMTPGMCMRMHLFILISHLYMHPRQFFNTKLQSFIKGKKWQDNIKEFESEIRITAYSVYSKRTG